MVLRHFLRLLSIGIIVVLSSLSWMVLAGVIDLRTSRAGSRLDGAVESLWGGPQTQRQPEVLLRWTEAPPPPPAVGEARACERKIPPARSRVETELNLDYRRKGLLWYSTYRANVQAAYTVRNDTENDGVAAFRFPLPTKGGVYDEFHLLVNGEEVTTLWPESGRGEARIEVETPLSPGEEAIIEVRYVTQGLDEWRYTFGGASHIRDFQLVVRTDFEQFDFDAAAMSPTRKERAAGGWDLTWEYGNLVGGRDIAVLMPKRLNPGPLAARICRFAPVSLVFFLGVLYFLYLLRDVPLHPIHYAFLAASFFSFHLLLAHLVDHLNLLLSFGIASAVSVFLVVTYLRVVVNARFAFFQAGSLQLLYLVLFSFAHFFEGWTGLTVTIGGIVTLFVIMQMTARVSWSDIFPESGRRNGVRVQPSP